MTEEIILKNLNAYEIQQYQQNRSPCYFVDCIVEAVPGKSAKGYKFFSFNEWFTPPKLNNQELKQEKPEIPEFILTETLVQVFLMTFLTIPENKGKKTAMITSDSEFISKVHCGKRLDIIANLDSFRRGLAKGRTIGLIEGKEVCRADFTVAIPDIMNKFRPKIN